jgi:hypothetical protein
MSAWIHINCSVEWTNNSDDPKNIERYGECMEMLRVGVEDEVRAFLEDQGYDEAKVSQCEASG